MSKVALCLSGKIGNIQGKSGFFESDPRVLTKGFEHYKRHIIDKNDVDVFIHCWDGELEEKTIVFEQSLRINNWEEPSDTITATGPEIHPNRKRRMSVRECAIIQTFPDDFIFEGAIGSMYKQIGNAVPVDLAFKIGCAIRKYL